MSVYADRSLKPKASIYRTPRPFITLLNALRKPKNSYLRKRNITERKGNENWCEVKVKSEGYIYYRGNMSRMAKRPPHPRVLLAPLVFLPCVMVLFSHPSSFLNVPHVCVIILQSHIVVSLGGVSSRPCNVAHSGSVTTSAKAVSRRSSDSHNFHIKAMFSKFFMPP